MAAMRMGDYKLIRGKGVGEKLYNLKDNLEETEDLQSRLPNKSREMNKAIETWEKGVLCIGRYYDGDKIIGVFNFSEFDKTAWINETDGDYVDLISGRKMKAAGVNIPAFGYYYLKKC